MEEVLLDAQSFQFVFPGQFKSNAINDSFIDILSRIVQMIVRQVIYTCWNGSWKLLLHNRNQIKNKTKTNKQTKEKSNNKKALKNYLYLVLIPAVAGQGEDIYIVASAI